MHLLVPRPSLAVPAKVQGTWKLPDGDLTLEQKYQMISGTMRSGSTNMTITGGKVIGDQIAFNAGTMQYTGRVNGNDHRRHRADLDRLAGDAVTSCVPGAAHHEVVGWTQDRPHLVSGRSRICGAPLRSAWRRTASGTQRDPVGGTS